MRRFLPTAGLILLIAGFAGGCIFSPSTTDPVIESGEYKEQTSPENVLNNLQVAYRRKESAPYAVLLRKDFIFRFQEVDQTEIGTEFWTRDQDSTGTHGLFNSPDISTIEIELTHGPATESDDLDLPDAMKIRVSPTKLEVLRLPDTTLLVDGDIQDFFFEKGDPDRGEDPELWYIVEWRDIPSAGGVGALTTLAADGVRRVSWGRLMHGMMTGAFDE